MGNSGDALVILSAVILKVLRNCNIMVGKYKVITLCGSTKF